MRHNGEFIVGAESVTEGHPNKLADLIADTIVDGVWAQRGVSGPACTWERVDKAAALRAGVKSRASSLQRSTPRAASANQVGARLAEQGL